MKSKISVMVLVKLILVIYILFLKEFGTLVNLRYMEFIHSKINFVNHDKLVRVKRCHVMMFVKY